MLYKGDCIKFLNNLDMASASVCITSPPYNIGKEYERRAALDDYLKWLNKVAGGIYNALNNSGSLFWQVGNMVDQGEVYPLDIITYPIFKELGFHLRNRIVWTFGHGLHCSKRLSGRHETILWFTKSDDYKFNLDDIRVPSKYPHKKHYKGSRKGQISSNPLGKNPGDVWDIPNVKHNHPEKNEHPCQFPEELVRRAILATTELNDLVIDPFLGSGTTAAVSESLGRRWAGSENWDNYWPIIDRRLSSVQMSIL